MGVFRRFAGAELNIVQICHGLTEGRDARRGAIFAGRDGDVDVSGLVEGIWDVVFDLGRALAEIAPFLWVVSEAVLLCFLGGPDNTAVEMTSVIMQPPTPAHSRDSRRRFARVQARVFAVPDTLQTLPEPLVW